MLNPSLIWVRMDHAPEDSLVCRITEGDPNGGTPCIEFYVCPDPSEEGTFRLPDTYEWNRYALTLLQLVPALLKNPGLYQGEVTSE